jgi:hypothetical protein
MTTPNPEASDFAPMQRLAQAVQREQTRRERLGRLYIALLAVPLVILGAFLMYGRSDREVIERAVESRVKPVEIQYQTVQSALGSVRDLDTILPRLNRTARRLDEQFAQMATVARMQDSLVRGVQVSRLDSSISELRAVQRRLSEQLARQDQIIRALGDPRTLQRRLDVLEGRVDSLRRLTRTPTRAVPTRP